MGNTTKRVLLLFLLVVLLLPAVEHSYNFIHSGALYGSYNIAEDTDFSFDGWWDGRFQAKKSKYDNDNVGFRPDLIRLNNQIDYMLFNKLHFWFGEMGTHGCVWDGLYIEAYLGIDYVGHDKILEKLRKLKKIQDTLTALGKTMVLIQAPCKGYYYPECFPDEYNKITKRTTNLEMYDHIADSLGVNQINFNTWFLSEKHKTTELLYPKQGIHWSLYGAALAADTFVKYVERKRGITMPHAMYGPVIHEKTARETDNDIGRQLNLVIPIDNEIFSYADITYPDETKYDKPKAIYIGDSFLCQWYFNRLFGHINTQWQIWYYFNTLCSEQYPYGMQNAPRVKDTDWMAEILKSDYVVLLYTAKNLPTLGDGFIEQAYYHFYPKK